MSSQLTFLRPKNLNESRILSWFSLKNAQYVASNSTIAGLNVGFNSKEHQEVILANLKALAKETTTNLKNIAIAQQVHKTHVEVVSKGGIYPETDAFVTNTPGLALMIQVADCGAILFGDSTHKVIGAAHAGWRGAEQGIVSKTVDQMLDQGAKLAHIHVYISPCISVNAFEVGEEVAQLFPEEFVLREGFNKPHIDLKSYIAHELMECGIPSKNILKDESCTVENDQSFYSFRRESTSAGRMAAVIKLNQLS